MSIKSKQHNVITLISGGTGGHIYPALAILCEIKKDEVIFITDERGYNFCLLYTSPSPRDLSTSRMPSSA